MAYFIWATLYVSVFTYQNNELRLPYANDTQG